MIYTFSFLVPIIQVCRLFTSSSRRCPRNLRKNLNQPHSKLTLVLSCIVQRSFRAATCAIAGWKFMRNTFVKMTSVDSMTKNDNNSNKRNEQCNHLPCNTQLQFSFAYFPSARSPCVCVMIEKSLLNFRELAANLQR